MGPEVWRGVPPHASGLLDESFGSPGSGEIWVYRADTCALVVRSTTDLHDPVFTLHADLTLTIDSSGRPSDPVTLFGGATPCPDVPTPTVVPSP